MDGKSIEILNRLQQCLLKRTLSASEFPKEDVMEMIHAEYEQWLDEQFYYLHEYITTYDRLIDHAAGNGNSIQLAELLDEFLDDLYQLPLDVPEKI